MKPPPVPKLVKYTLLPLRDLLVSAGPFALLAVLLLALAYWWLDPMPPKHIRLATGPAQSAYDEFGKRYAKALAKSGIQVQLVPSEGSSQNLQLLHDGQADIGFVQGGSGAITSGGSDDFQAMGSLFLEPVWLFYHAGAASKVQQGTPTAVIDALPQLKGLRVNVGTPGSGVPALMDKLFDANHMDPGNVQLARLAQTPATVAFLNGELDALVFASAPESPMVQMLLQTPDVKLMNFAQSEAYARRFAFLSPVVLPRGVVDLAGDVPAQNVRLIATTTTLLAREDVHPALLQLFAQAGLDLHHGAGWFNRAREFPNAANTEFPLAKEAERTIQNGVPLLQRYLPFSLANLMERMWLALGIIVAILLPLSRIVPPLYQFRIRSRIFRWYGQLRDIEARHEQEPASAPTLLEELNRLEQRVGKVSVPLSYNDELYSLRNHIELVRQRLSRV
jgi:TRAP transporter TAXI family solute receptor